MSGANPKLAPDQRLSRLGHRMVRNRWRRRRERTFAEWVLAHPDYVGRLPGSRRGNLAAILFGLVPLGVICVGAAVSLTAAGVAPVVSIGAPMVAAIAVTGAATLVVVSRVGIWLDRDSVEFRGFVRRRRFERFEVAGITGAVPITLMRSQLPYLSYSIQRWNVDRRDWDHVECNLVISMYRSNDELLYLLNRWLMAPVRAAERAAGPRWPQPGDGTRLRALIEQVLLDSLATLDRPRAREVERPLVNELLELALDHRSADTAASLVFRRWVGTRGRVLDQPAKAKLRADLRATGGFDPFWWHGVQASAPLTEATDEARRASAPADSITPQ